MKKKHWIAGAVKKPGSLRRTLHAKAGQKIGAAKLRKATHSKNPKTRKRAILAETFKKMRGRKEHKREMD